MHGLVSSGLIAQLPGPGWSPDDRSFQAAESVHFVLAQVRLTNATVWAAESGRPNHFPRLATQVL
ncbi:MAG: hypothetical protein ACFB9M_20275 [Myxococcota bacterium]